MAEHAASNFGSALHHLVSIMSHESDQLLLEQLGIGLAQYKILSVLKDHPQIRQRSIAYELGQTEASISRQIKLLQTKAMLMSRVNPRNHREHLADLTEKGLRTIIAANGVLEKYHENAVSHLSDKQVQQLGELLAVVHDTICSPKSHIPNTYGELLQGM